MKINYFHIICLIPALFSCSNELDLVSPDEPVPVVYCRLNPADSVFYITLTRSFSGTGNGYNLAKDADKVYFPAAAVRLESWINEYKVGEIRFEPNGLTKNPGIFPEISGYCYQAVNKSGYGGGDVGDERINSFRLVVDLPGEAGPVTAKIQMVPLPAQSLPSIWENQFNLYPDTGNFQVKYGIDHKYIKYCELVCDFRYEEFENKWVSHTLSISLRKDMLIFLGPDKKWYAQSFLYPDQFFNKIATNIEPAKEDVVRRFKSLDLIFLAGDQNYKDYNDSYIITGNMDAAPIGNINNGYGLFTMVRSLKIENMKVSYRTLDSLAAGQYTKQLGFSNW